MKESLKELKTIPGVGNAVARILYDIGIRSVADLEKNNPESLYKKANELLAKDSSSKQNVHDICLLYVFRCAVYYASTADPEPDLLLWWNWKYRGL